MTAQRRVESLIRFVLVLGVVSAVFVVAEDYLETPEAGDEIAAAGSRSPATTSTQIPTVPANTTAPGHNQTRTAPEETGDALPPNVVFSLAQLP